MIGVVPPVVPGIETEGRRLLLLGHREAKYPPELALQWPWQLARSDRPCWRLMLGCITAVSTRVSLLAYSPLLQSLRPLISTTPQPRHSLYCSRL